MVLISAYLIHAEVLKSCVKDFIKVSLLHVKNTGCDIKKDNDLTGFTFKTKKLRRSYGNVAQCLLFVIVTYKPLPGGCTPKAFITLFRHASSSPRTCGLAELESQWTSLRSVLGLRARVSLNSKATSMTLSVRRWLEGILVWVWLWHPASGRHPFSLLAVATSLDVTHDFAQT